MQTSTTVSRVLAALALFAATPAAADALVDNVTGVALDKDGRVIRFTGILMSPDGKVVKLMQRGDKRPERLDWRADMKGKVAIPGMIDAHGHVMDLGFRALSLDLFDTTSLEQAKAKLAAYAAANPQRPWIVGGGWNQEVWKLGRFPTAADIDAVTGNRPVWLQRADGHAGLANTAAMRAAGITARTATPAGGRIEKGANGQPTGVFVDGAMDLIAKHLPPPTARDRDAAFLKAQEALLSAGITATADMGTEVDDWLTYRRMGDQNLLRVRIMAYSAGVDPAIKIGGQGPTPWLYADRLRMGGIKLYADGALGSRGAWLKAPYADSPGNSGLGFLKDDQLLNLMSRGAMDNFQIAVHAIGDRANAQVLDAIDELSESYKGDRRWRIEHAQIVDPVDLPRFGRNGTIASMQPVHESSDWRMAEARLGPARLGGAYAWAQMLRVGSRLAFGSDYPVENPNPFVGWAVAFTRLDANGEPFGGWRPEDRVTREQAWKAFTSDAAYAGFAESKFGTLAPGLRADFVIVDRDPTEVSQTDLRGTRVLETWVGGEKMWAAK
ncbi:amidohydrolase family protein [Sphingomonas donggukensis]|uniref:Amidohydrolase family protein n=1 Tax=Sphingomonas donggukensis TaxID=2949093 RepID=A0ABY4TW46_9SPHN|nr:amidohydrolase family protein [Sphingomonas donggukensis]URW76105.1 amidohydrolase family protein [Sphingomonas donggukensis]